jgi:hypothetical protein
MPKSPVINGKSVQLFKYLYIRLMTAHGTGTTHGGSGSHVDIQEAERRERGARQATRSGRAGACARQPARRCRGGEWQRLHEFLEATRDADARFFYVDTLSDVTGRPGWMDEWCAARPASAVPLLFRASHGRHWAWQARGSGLARTVKEDSWPLFHERLVAADRDLARAAELDPEDPLPHALGLWVVYGLSLGQAELLRRFGEVDRRHRWHLGAYRAIRASPGQGAGRDAGERLRVT